MADAHDAEGALNAGGAVGPLDSSPDSPSNRIVPEAVAQRFLRIDDRYFFPDRTLAFIDTGARLKVRTHNLEVVHSIVAIMQARGWQTVRVTGTSEFRQTVWHEATLRGIGVQGYQPSTLEMQQLQRALDHEQAARRARQAEEAQIGPRPASNRSPDPSRPARDAAHPARTGVLLAHAAAPFQFDPSQRLSYYVRLRTEAGERTFWGADLERALAESRSGVQLGDEVVLSQRGAQPVTVRVPERDAQGDWVRDKKLLTHRTNWSVESVQYADTLAKKAAMLRSGAVDNGRVLSQYPDLAGAMVGIRLAERFAQRLTVRADDRARMVQAIRSSLADAIAQGHGVKMPVQRERRAHVQHRARGAPAFEDPGHSRA